jgi:hypothetical protein
MQSRLDGMGTINSIQTGGSFIISIKWLTKGSESFQSGATIEFSGDSLFFTA